MAGKLSGSAIQSNTITVTQLSTTTVTTIVNQTGPRVTSLVYPGNDTAGNTVGGQTVYINGTGFETNNAIYINGNAVPSKSFISASNLSFTTPALTAGIYPVYVINTDSGATAIFVPGYIASAEPSWVTSAGSLNSAQDESSTWSYSLSATGDAPITYALAVGSSLPTGISLAANGLISGTLSSPPGTETTYTFSVVATDAQNQDSTRQFTVTTTSGEGVLFANNVLLIHADGTNNQNNHAFLDSSNNNFTITRNGNATQGSFSPFSQTGWSNYFDGSGDYLSFPSDAAFGFGTGDITIECWFYHTSRSTTATLFSNANDTLNLYINTSGVFGVYDGSVRNSSQTVPLNSWNHFAYVRSSGTAKLYYNGTEVLSFSSSTNYGTSAARTGVNYGGGSGSDYATGFISNLRVLKGTALYTSNFTPSTTPLTAVANTSLLTCQSNRFVDNSTNAFTITRNGDVSVHAFSPFAPTAAYSTANVGGSGYFDGTGDYLTVPAGSAFAYGTGDFTVEGWFYATAEPAAFGSTLFAQTVTGTNYFICTLGSDASPSTRVVRFQFGTSGGGTGISTSATYNLNSWNHFAIVRNSGSVTVYLNGVGGTSGSCTQNFSDTSYVPTIGRYTHSDTCPFTGYLSNFRVVKGTAVYTTNFTPPTTLLTNINNTSLLTNFTNAGIFDQTAKNVIETAGDAKISTSVYKYGTGSIVFDGTDDRLLIPTSPNLAFGTGNFTIEAWVNRTASGSVTHFIDFRGSNNNGSNPVFYWQTNNYLYYTNDNSSGDNQIQSSNAITSSSGWVHVAIVRSGTTLTVYVNGVASGSVTYSTNVLGGNPVTIGNRFNNSGAYAGYIDDLRITKGYARYTSNFTPPAAAFKDK
jgi:hypothetical protein